MIVTIEYVSPSGYFIGRDTSDQPVHGHVPPSKARRLRMALEAEQRPQATGTLEYMTKAFDDQAKGGIRRLAIQNQAIVAWLDHPSAAGSRDVLPHVPPLVAEALSRLHLEQRMRVTQRFGWRPRPKYHELFGWGSAAAKRGSVLRGVRRIAEIIDGRFAEAAETVLFATGERIASRQITADDVIRLLEMPYTRMMLSESAGDLPYTIDTIHEWLDQ